MRRKKRTGNWNYAKMLLLAAVALAVGWNCWEVLALALDVLGGRHEGWGT